MFRECTEYTLTYCAIIPHNIFKTLPSMPSVYSFGILCSSSHSLKKVVQHITEKKYLRTNKQEDISPILNWSERMRSKWGNWERKVYIKTDIFRSASLSFWESENAFVKIYLQVCCRSQRNAWQRQYHCSFCRTFEVTAAVKTYGVIFLVMALCSLVRVYTQYLLFIYWPSLCYSASSLRWSTRCKIMPCSICLCAPGIKYRLDHIPVFQGPSLPCRYRFIS